MKNPVLIKSLNRKIGLFQRIGMALLALTSPANLILSTVVGFTEAIDEMDETQIKAMFHDE